MREQIALIVAILLFLGCSPHAERNAPHEGSTSKKVDKTTPAATIVHENVLCPVCGLKFSREEAQSSTKYSGKTYYFLLEDHKKAFIRDSAKYLE